MCSTVQEQITTCGQNAIVKIGERTNIRPQKGGWRVGEGCSGAPPEAPLGPPLSCAPYLVAAAAGLSVTFYFLGTDVSPFPNFNNSVLTTRRNLLLHC